ncbi:MAG: hypothetical protein AB7E95_11945 [Kiritimatiellales bacterium]
MSSKKSFGLALIVLGFTLLALTGIRTISSPEIFTHIALGQASGGQVDPLSYTMTGSQWINMYPLYDKLVAALWALGGAGLITLTHVLIVLAAFILMFRFGREWGGPLSQTLALLLCARLMFPVFTPGPYVFFMLFTALYVTCLYRIKNFYLMAAVILPLQILWTNLHPSFLFGPALILFFAIENWQQTSKRSRTAMISPLTARLLALTGAALLVTLINPNLINLHRHVLANWLMLTGTNGLEWISLFSSFFSQKFISRLTVFALILGAGGLITLQKRLPSMITLLALTGAFLTVRSIGSLHLFAFLAFPFLILSFTAVSEYLSRTLTTVCKTNEKTLHMLMSVITLILLAVSISSLITNRGYARIGSAAHFGLGVQEDAFPYAAAGILGRDDFPERIINIAHDGGYLAVQNPDRKIFCDTRTSFYGDEFYQTLNKALLGQPEAWKSVLSDWNPHAVVLNACWPDAGSLANRLIASQAWKLVYFDGSTVILIRDLPEYASLINDPAIQKYGVTVLEQSRREYIENNKGFIKAGNPSRLIGAGSIYLVLNRAKEAESVYSALTQGNPDMAGAWLGLGQSMILQKQLSKGIEYMERAVDLTPQSGRIWISLFQGYRLKGDEDKARRASEQLNKFFKADKATIEQQEAATAKKPVEKPAVQQQKDGLELPSQLK